MYSTFKRRTYLGEMFGGHLRENSIEVSLVVLVDESVMEDPLSLVAEETVDLLVFPNHSWVSLEHSCSGQGRLTITAHLDYVSNTECTIILMEPIREKIRH